MSVPPDQMSPMAGQMIDPSQMSPEEIQQIMLLGGIPEKQALLMAQMKQADALRDEPAPEGRTGPGRLGMYTAPHPLEVIAHALRQYQGIGHAGYIDTQIQANAEKQTKGRQAFAKALLRQQRLLDKLRGSQGTSGLPAPPGSEDPGG